MQEAPLSGLHHAPEAGLSGWSICLSMCAAPFPIPCYPGEEGVSGSSVNWLPGLELVKLALSPCGRKLLEAGSETCLAAEAGGRPKHPRRGPGTAWLSPLICLQSASRLDYL